jgi:hypothetical protein
MENNLAEDVSTIEELLIVHGLQLTRSVTALDDVVKGVLDQQFQEGVEKSSNRKSVLEMVNASRLYLS